MGDVKILLREAVPLDDIEPDLTAVADRARRRRRRRLGGRVAAGAAAMAVVLVAGATAGTGLFDRDQGTNVATARDEGGHPPRGTVDPAGPPDPAAFTELLASRSWSAMADPDWPLQPSDFIDGTPEPGMIVIGTLADVRPGFVTVPPCGSAPSCLAQTTVETVVRIETVAPGDQAYPDDEIAVPWVTGRVDGTELTEVDEAINEERAAAFADAAPIGARVVVFLRPGGGDPYEWRPEEPSGIVIEDADGIAVPRPDADAPRLDWTFDEYLAELDRLITAS